ncbi:MAG TPA: TAXI family TRAP transporter solute-binding subunit [Stellaceae bacterium]|nr:TAXI family TRAP transporter solute-binding subunit [Stellaceae bacterium]
MHGVSAAAMLRKYLAAILSVASIAMVSPALAQNSESPNGPTLTSSDSGDAAARRRHALRERENRGLVGFLSGDIESTDLRAATDLATVVDGADQEVHILPLVGNDAIQNAKDLAVTRGVDVAIIQADVLDHLKREPFFPGLENYLQYVTKLYDEEVHVLARKEVTTLDDLAGKKVNVDRPGSGAAITAATIFDALHLTVEPTHFDPALALEKLKAGDIAALVYVSGKPAPLFMGLGPNDNVHFLPLRAAGLPKTYSAAALTAQEYPGLIDKENHVDTVAVGAVMMAYNWPPGSERFRRVTRFVDAFFDHLKDLQQSPRHPKWHHIDLAAPVSGWTRFAPAERRVRSAALAPKPDAARDPAPDTLFKDFAEYLRHQPQVQTASTPQSTLDVAQRDGLFRDFETWRNAAAQPLHQQRRDQIFWEFAAWSKALSESTTR